MARARILPAALLLVGTPALFGAQATPSGSSAGTIKPKVECSQMAGRTIPASAIALPTRGATVKSAKMDPGTGRIPIPADFVPEHCYIEGAIKPVDPAAPDINFAIAIPVNWNQKAWHIAGNGNDGFIPLLTTLARGLQGSPVGASLPPHAPFPITQGYATYGDDSGHKGGASWLQRLSGAPLPAAPTRTATARTCPAWMRNDEAFWNYGYEHISGARRRHGHLRRHTAQSPGSTTTASLGLTAAQAAVRGTWTTTVSSSPSEIGIRRDPAASPPEAAGRTRRLVPPAKQDAFRLETLRLCDTLTVPRRFTTRRL